MKLIGVHLLCVLILALGVFVGFTLYAERQCEAYGFQHFEYMEDGFFCVEPIDQPVQPEVIYWPST